MSGENNSSRSLNFKRKKKVQLSASRPSGSNTSDVLGLKKTQEKSNVKAFASITHKNSSGANNWTKFTEVFNQNKGSRSLKNTLNNRNQHQTPNLSEDKINLPSKLPINNGRPTDYSQSKNKQRYFLSNAPVESSFQNNVPASVLDKNVNPIKSKNEISNPILTKHIAMDCEMVGVEIGVNKNLLARISLVNSHGDCIYDKYVKPTEPVLDYRTRVSGVRPKDLENATDFKIVQREVADMLKGRTLVGHALKNDLKVLYLSHPKHSIRDTSKFHKFREGRTPALKKLAKKYLGVVIQEGEHSSVQDALAAMQLYKMFKKEWESSIFSKKQQIKKGEKIKTSQPTPIQTSEVM